MKKSLLPFVAIAMAAAMLVGGCGGGDDGDSSSSGGYGGSGSSTTNEAARPGKAAIVSAATVPELGKVIVDSRGFTLYDFHKDKGGRPSCYGSCAKVWPPLTTDGEPRAGEGANASQLGTVKRSDGTVQVTYAGYPLYTYAADREPGDAKGNDIDSFGAEWYALRPSGEEAEG